MLSIQSADEILGAYPGDYYLIRYRSKFEKGEITEVVTVDKDKKGVWRVSYYDRFKDSPKKTGKSDSK